MEHLPHIQKLLDLKDLRFLKNIGALAYKSGIDLFLVGGCVRDAFLKTPIKDFDIVANAPLDQIIGIFTNSSAAEMISRSQFETAKLRYQGGQFFDLAVTREEIYEQPGSLPTITRSSIEEDLWRRDFSINAIGINLNPISFGQVIDPTGGRKDLISRTIRVLHRDSFKDDSTRILRGIRYATRLKFKFERTTFNLLQEGRQYFKSISGSRLHNEIEKISNEENVVNCLKRAHKLGVLRSIDPAFGHPDILKSICALRKVPITVTQILAMLTYECSDRETTALIRRLNLASSEQKAIVDSNKLRVLENTLAEKPLSPSLIYKALNNMSVESLLASCFLAKIRLVRQRIRRFLMVWRHVKPLLNGTEIMQLGVPSGPMVGEILSALLLKLIDRQIISKKAQETYVRYLIESPTTKFIS